MISSNLIGIVADDITEINDGALQFHLKGAHTQVVLDCENIQKDIKNIQVWAVTTGSRGFAPKEAYLEVQKACEKLSKDLGIDKFFKKIDTYFRGNIGIETISMIETLGLDAGIIIPASPAFNITTVGGYQLVKGLPIERTEIARDVMAPVTETHIPSLIKNQIGEDTDIIGHLELKDVMHGAGPILIKIRELVNSGKKIIIADAVSNDDIEQIILATMKSKLNILPIGTTATAKILADKILEEEKHKEEEKPIKIPNLKKLIVSGSPTHLCRTQIEKLTASEEIENKFAISIDMKTLMEGINDDIVNKILTALDNNDIVTIHASSLIQEFDGFSDDSLDNELTKPKLISKTANFLAELTAKVVEQKDVILITLGSQTSIKCCKAINSLQLQIIDEVAPQIALSLDYKSQWIASKSGYVGNSSTLIEILKYFKNHLN